MQKLRFLIFFGLLGVSFWLAGHFSSLSKPPVGRHEMPDFEKAAIGTADDPQARDRYEWMRLHDPATGEIPAKIREDELAFAAKLPTQEALAGALAKSSGSAAIQATTWSARGPRNVGGRTRALAIDVANANLLLAGGVSGGIWRSTNGGASWTKTTAPSDLHSVTCVAQDTRNAKTNIWYYGTGEWRGNSASGGGGFYLGDGIFKSTNGGLSWALLPSTATNTPQTFDQMFDFVWNVAADPSNAASDEVYAATYGGINRSLDGGASWTPVLGSAANGADYTDVAITNSGAVYATLSSDGATTKGIRRSADGVTWANITPAGWPAAYRRIVIGIAPSNPNVVYFLAETPGSGLNGHSLWKYTYVSGDGTGAGGTWVNRSANLPAFGAPAGNFDSQGSYDLVVKVKPDNSEVVFIGGTNLYRSTDGFATTANTKWIGGYNSSNTGFSLYPNHHPDQHAIAFSPASATTMFSGHDGGVSKTTNNLAAAVVWAAMNSGYMTSQFYTVAIDHATSGNNIIIGGTQDNGTWFTNSTLATTPWLSLMGGDGAYSAIANGRTSYYGSFQNGVVYRLLVNDAGSYTQWTRVDPTRAAGAASYLFINPFILDPNNSNLMYLAGGDRIWRNSDLTGIALLSNGTTSTNWMELTNTAVAGAAVTALAVSKTPANRLYFGTNNGRVYRANSANAGNPALVDVWTGKGFPLNAYVSSIAVDPNNADRVLVVFSNYSVVSLFYTTNGGTSWTPVAGNLEQNPDGSGKGPSCRWAAILPTGGATVYFAGTSTGLYSTTNLNGAATVWALEGASTIGNVVVDMIDTRLSDRLVVAATHGQGVFSANLPVIRPRLNVPTNLAAGILKNFIALKWQTPALNDSLTLLGFNIYCSTKSPVQVTPQNRIGKVAFPATAFVDTSVARGNTFYYVVTAVYAQGESAPSKQAGINLPCLSWQVNLTVTDAGRASAVLSLGQGPTTTNHLDKGCGELELPPMPPAGVFDARFELPVAPPMASRQDFRNDSTKALRWRLKFQPRTSGPIIFAWNRANFPAGSFFLKDEITGALVNVDMKKDSVYRLDNANITSLKIENGQAVCRNVSVISNWNLVAVPLFAANMSVDSLFPGAATQAFGYNNGYVAAATLQNGVGYWLKFAGAKTYQICGVPVSPAIPVNAGWNMIGPFDADVPAASITSTPSGIVISGYYGFSGAFVNATVLKVGKGYWVKASQSGLLHLPSSSAAVKIAEDGTTSLLGDVNDAWPQIRIEDAAGKAATLYLAPANEYSGNFELPPTPPQGIFDVRFGSGQFVESLGAGRFEVLVSSALYPIRITARNFGERTFAARDALGGQMLNATLAAGREITIASPVEKIVLAAATLPAGYALSQNAPNPFNPAAVINFSLPEKSHVKITVYSLKGEKMAELVNEDKPAGYHQVQINGRGYASGVYFYVMEAGTFRSLKKMMIIK
jgi:hypothetical protein